VGTVGDCSNTNAVLVGGWNGGTDRVPNGILDDVRIYSRVLLPDEIMVLYAGAGSIRG
jgi:hypothetical protein